jgi:hypothetical protein
MLIQRKSDKKFLTLSLGWVSDPMCFSLASTSRGRFKEVCQKININPEKLSLIRFEQAYSEFKAS